MVDRAPSRLEEIRGELIGLFLAEGFLDLGVGDLAARLRCSRSSLYAIAPSKDELIVVTVREFFRRATVRVEERLATDDDATSRITTYLEAIAEQLASASARFLGDVEAFAPAREIYRQNTRFAAARVEELVRLAAGGGADVDAEFVGAVAAQTMEAIRRGEIRALTGRDDAAAYRALARLVSSAVSGS